MVYGITGNTGKDELWSPVAQLVEWLHARGLAFRLHQTAPGDGSRLADAAVGGADGRVGSAGQRAGARLELPREEIVERPEVARHLAVDLGEVDIEHTHKAADKGILQPARTNPCDAIDDGRQPQTRQQVLEPDEESLLHIRNLPASC